MAGKLVWQVFILYQGFQIGKICRGNLKNLRS